MKEFLKKNQQKISLLLGVLLLTSGVILKIINQPEEISQEERIALANIARMEARMNKNSTSGSTKSSGAGLGVISAKEKENYAFIMMIIFGVGFLGHSIYSLKKS